MNEYKILNEMDYVLKDQINYTQFFYERKVPSNPEQNDSRNKFIFKYNLSGVPIDYGEALASIIGRRTIGNVCEAELTKRIRTMPFGKVYEDTGVVSYYAYSSNESLYNILYMMSEFLKERNLPKELALQNVADIEYCLDMLEGLIVYKEKRPISEFLSVKQQFIDMVMFDCKFGNYDRRLENWFLKRNKKTGKFDIYELFDNEAILGFDIDETSLELSENETTELSSTEQLGIIKRKYEKAIQGQRFTEIIPFDREAGRSNYIDIMNYIMQHYNKEFQESYRKLKAYTYQDLCITLDEFSLLSDKRKGIAKRMFLIREHELDKVYLKSLGENDVNKTRNAK